MGCRSWQWAVLSWIVESKERMWENFSKDMFQFGEARIIGSG